MRHSPPHPLLPIRCEDKPSWVIHACCIPSVMITHAPRFRPLCTPSRRHTHRSSLARCFTEPSCVHSASTRTRSYCCAATASASSSFAAAAAGGGGCDRYLPLSTRSAVVNIGRCSPSASACVRYAHRDEPQNRPGNKAADAATHFQRVKKLHGGEATGRATHRSILPLSVALRRSVHLRARLSAVLT